MSLVLAASLPLAAWVAAWLLLAGALRRRFPSLVSSRAAGLVLAYVGLSGFWAFLALALSPFQLIHSAIFRVAGLLLLAAIFYYWHASPALSFPNLESASSGFRRPVSWRVLIRWGPWAAAGFVLVLGFTWALVCPPNVWDALSYHLPMAATYLQQHGLDVFANQNPRQITSPHAGELQILAFLAWAGNDIGLEFPGLLALAALLCVAQAGVARRETCSRSSAAAAALFVLTVPQLLATAVSGKPDLAACAFIAAAAWAALESSRRAPLRGRQDFYAAVAGFSAALALGTKVLGGNAALALAALAGSLWVQGRWNLRRCIVAALAALPPGLLLVGLHSLRSYRAYGTILGFPPRQLAVLEDAWLDLWTSLGQNALLLGETLLRPFTWFGREPSSEHAHLGFAVLAGVVVATVWGIGRIRKRRDSWKSGRPMHGLEWPVYLLVFVLSLLLARRQEFFVLARFLLPLVPILALSLFGGWRARRGPPRGTLFTLALLAVWVAASSFATPFFFAHLDLGLRQGRPLATGESPLGQFGEGAGYEALEQHAAAGDRVLYVGGNNSLMYPCFGQRLDRTVWGVAGLADLQARLAQRPEWIVVERTSQDELRAAGVWGAWEAGYTYVFRGEVRVILWRPQE